METGTFCVGDIVCLRTHPYFENQTSIVITGDHLSIPPIMVITEVLNNGKTQYDEYTREETTTKTECKCVWFSTKSNQFVDSWLPADNLKLIRKALKEGVLDSIPIDSLVVFKTLPIEIKKQKSSISIDGFSSPKENVNTHVTALLSFVSPVLQVISIKKNEEKVPKFDAKTGVQKRFTSAYLVKCKWYNYTNDKMSEVILPIDCLQILPKISKATLNIITEDILRNSHYTANIDGAVIMFKPLKVTFRSGFYYLNGLNYITNRMDEVLIEENIFARLDNHILADLPKFDDLSTTGLSEAAKQELVAALTDDQLKRNYLRIIYKNRNDNISTRTIKNPEVIASDDGIPVFVKGYCFLRQEIRTFRIDRIQRLQVLNLLAPTEEVNTAQV